MKLTRKFRCVLPGEIYPVDLEAGEECPEGYEESARAQGAFDEVEANSEPNREPEPQPDPEAQPAAAAAAEVVGEPAAEAPPAKKKN